MINCIDYAGIIGVENDNEREDLTQFININNFFDLHGCLSFIDYLFCLCVF